MHKQNLTSTCQVILPKEEFSSGCIYGIMRCIYGMIYCIYYKTRVNTTDAVVKKEKSFGNLQASQSKISILKQTHKSVIKLKLAPEISQRQFCTLLSSEEWPCYSSTDGIPQLTKIFDAWVYNRYQKPKQIVSWFGLAAKHWACKQTHRLETASALLSLSKAAMHEHWLVTEPLTIIKHWHGVHCCLSHCTIILVKDTCLLQFGSVEFTSGWYLHVQESPYAPCILSLCRFPGVSVFIWLINPGSFPGGLRLSQKRN